MHDAATVRTVSPGGLKAASGAALAGAWLWLFCFQFFVAEQIVRLHVHGPYSMARNAISDLGAVHAFSALNEPNSSFSVLHAWMNASFCLQGMLIVGGALLLRRLFPKKMTASLAFLLFQISGLALFVVGLVPEDSVADLHVLAASIHFVCGSLAMLFLGVVLLSRTKVNGAWGMLSVGAGMLALAATLVLGFGHTTEWSLLGWPAGAMERVAAYPLPLWLSLTGAMLLRAKQPPLNTRPG